MSLQNYKRKANISIGFILSFVFILISVFVIFNKQRIVDQVTVWRYAPSSEVESLVNRAGMNENGKFYYFASQPKLDSTQAFNVECDRIENSTSILGCYTNLRIYIYDVTDEQLDGVREVTAAHETLHAIYFRLSEKERSTINGLLEAEYEKHKDKKDFSELMEFYDRTEPGQRNNELHSIIGTEVINISPELETYYAKYFSNRMNVVELNAKYTDVFRSLKNRADELLIKLNEHASLIKTNTDLYNADVNKLSNDISAFNARVDNGDFSSQWAFNAERQKLVNRTIELERIRKSMHDDISTYDSMVNEYNSIASQSKKLYNVIDSTLAPAPSV